MILLAISFFIIYALFARVNFRLASGFLILLLPSYLIRFSFGPLPTTLLELSFGAIFLVWLWRYAREDWPKILALVKKNKWLFAMTGLLLAAAAIASFVGADIYESRLAAAFSALGIWRAYFLEPILFFIILLARSETKQIFFWLALSTVSISVLAIVQKLTGQFYPPSLWDAQLFGRPTSFFTSANAIGLYLGPIVMLTLCVIARKRRRGADEAIPLLKQGDRHVASLLAMTLIITLAIVAIFLSRSAGALFALGVGLLVFIFSLGWKKLATTILLCGLATIILFPPLRTTAIFQDQAGQNRLALWKYSTEFLTESPKNFIFGAGLRKFFRQVQRPHYDPTQMERLAYPHNLFLNFWLETGLLGLLAFLGLLGWAAKTAWKIKKAAPLIGAGLLAALTAFFIHGLVDVPYFKNDLAMIFWIIMAAIALTSISISSDSARAHRSE